MESLSGGEGGMRKLGNRRRSRQVREGWQIKLALCGQGRET